MIPKNIDQDHILSAIREIAKKGIPKSRKSKRFQLFYNGKYYPPKYVISLANKYANRMELEPSEFSGGQETNSFLENLGFKIVEFLPSRVFPIPSYDQRKIRKRKGLKHDERCPECKKTIETMLRKIYGEVEVNYKFVVGTKPGDYRESPFYSKLKEIFLELQNHRGYKAFVRSQTLPRCDFFVPNPGFIVEFDESQHFTACREIALSKYPERLEHGFNRKKWIELCEKIDAQDNDPPYRDEQRAWYDTLRDFIPAIRGLKPTVRIFSQDFRWCSLNPDVPSDIRKFKAILKERKQKWTIEIREDTKPSLARIIIAGDWNGNHQTARELLEEICAKWPEGKKVKCLITCGGFLNFGWPDSLPDIGDNKNPNPHAVKCLQEDAEKHCRLLLNRMYEKLQDRTSYLTIGVDSSKSKISTTKNYISERHVELVCLVDLKRKKYYWTGKSYPTPNQERGLVRICNLRSHFYDLDFGKVMVLGCHDLTIFNPRSQNAKGWRKRVNKQFRDLAKKEEPTLVLQHPHTTDSIRTWAAAWSGLRKILPTVEKYASAGKYYNPDGNPRSRLERVLKKTKYGNTIDIIVGV